jgi:hypothetical protein
VASRRLDPSLLQFVPQQTCCSFSSSRKLVDTRAFFSLLPGTQQVFDLARLQKFLGDNFNRPDP